LPLKKQLKDLGVTDIVKVETDKSLFEAYEEGTKRAKNDVICYMHEDIEIVKFPEAEILAHFTPRALETKRTGFLGIAGSKEITHTGCWWDALNQPNQGMILSGQAGHHVNGERYISNYGPFGNVVVLDGVMLITHKQVLADIGGWLDPYLTGFDFYDIATTFKAHCMGWQNKTIQIDIYHKSPGNPRRSWERAKQMFVSKNYSKLPIKIR
jgi:hypothetical protein